MHLFPIVIFCIVWGFILSAVAINKGLDPSLWFIWGALFGPLALLFIFMSKKKASKQDHAKTHRF